MSSGDINKAIQKFLEENPLTLEQMATGANISVRSLCDYKSGRREPSRIIRAKLLRAFPELLPSDARQ